MFDSERGTTTSFASTGATWTRNLLLCPPSDSHPCGLPDRRVWRCFQPQGPQGGSAGRDGPVGGHPHHSPCVGPQPQDLHVSQRAAGVSRKWTRSDCVFDLFYFLRYLKILVFHSEPPREGINNVQGGWQGLNTQPLVYPGYYPSCHFLFSSKWKWDVKHATRISYTRHFKPRNLESQLHVCEMQKRWRMDSWQAGQQDLITMQR